MSPWEVLDLPDGEPVAAADLKRAYARKVKQHPPDVDPEGFQLVREAYEILGAWTREAMEEEPGGMEDIAAEEPTVLAERRIRPAPPDDLPPPPSRTPAPETRRREARADDLADVDAAAALPKGKERDKKLHAALRALADRMQEDRGLVAVWSRALLETVDDPERPRLVVSYARYGDIVLDLFEAEGLLAGRVFRIFRSEGKFDRLKRLALAVLDHRGEPRHDVGLPFAFLAASVAIVAPDAARGLADRAFRGATRKEEATPAWLDLDRLLAAGEEALVASEPARTYLAARLDRTAPDRAGEPIAMRLVARLSRSSALRSMLLERDPGFVAAADKRFPRKRPAPEAQAPGWRSVVGLIWAVVVVIGALSRSCEPTPSKPDDLRKILEEHRKRDMDRDLDKMMKEIREKYGLDRDPVGTPPNGSR